MVSTARALIAACALAAATPYDASRTPRAEPLALSPDARERLARSASDAVGLRHHLDRTRALVGADRAQRTNGTSLTGRGVVVGLIDTGVDISHPDLRDADGSTRVAWMIDYASSPAGLHPELESRFGFDAADGRRGAVYDRADLDARLQRGTAPDDRSGHGTHALSIALGGRVGGRYVGIAPGATPVVVRASLSAEREVVPEALAALGAAFVFDRADATRSPAVATLSLGTHHGAHDGDSALERALAALVRDGDAPGRAIVVSAGNGGARALHAHIDLGVGETVPLALRQPLARPGLVGVAIAYAGSLSVALRWPDGVESERVPTGLAGASRRDDGSRVSISNGLDGGSPRTGSRVADVLLDVPGDATLLLRGEGRADAWIFLDGEARGAGELPRFAAPWGDDEASVEIPGTSPHVITVGALTTRPLRAVAVDGAVATFSARGPTRAWDFKPDLVAPGDAVIAALSSQARDAPSGPFSDPAAVVDDAHAAASGTSAAAPHVAGAVALLFEERPEATQRELAAALTAGARAAPTGAADRWNAAEGWGLVDVPGALAMLRAGDRNGPASLAHSSCARPVRTLVADARLVIACVLRDDHDMPTTGRVALHATTGAAEPAAYLGGGRYALGYVAGAPGSAALTATVGDATLARWDVEVSATRFAYATSGGCSVANDRARPRWLWAFALLALSRRGRR